MPAAVPPLRMLLIDNHDSYTYNLSHLLAKANSSFPPHVVPADAYPSLSALLCDLGTFDAYVVSPGPGTPERSSDLSAVAAEALADPSIPALGVCLGHQALCAAAGASIIRGPGGPAHGRVSRAVPDTAARCPVLGDLPVEGVDVVRYHSLVVSPATLPDCLVPTAWCFDTKPDGTKVPVLMAVRHARNPLYGVQFHPESVLTDCGLQIARNFVLTAHSYREQKNLKFPRQVRGRPSHVVSDQGDLGKYELLAVRSHRLSCSIANSADVFSALYGNAERSFWLDSSSSSTSASLSRCSSSEMQTTSEVQSSSSAPVDLRGRFSLMGDLSGPRAELVTYDVANRCVSVHSGCRDTLTSKFTGVSIFDYLEKQLERRRVCRGTRDEDISVPVEMNGGYVGYIGYEAKADVFNDASKVRNVHSSRLPDAWFVFADRTLVYDHSDRSIYLLAVVSESSKRDLEEAEHWFSSVEKCLNRLSGISRLSSAMLDPGSAHGRGLEFSLERDQISYEKDVAKCLELIKSGETYEVCLTNRLRGTLPENARNYSVLSIYQTLRLVNPAPYSAFLRLSQDTAVCCSSPERFLSASSDAVVESKPIKGTRPRGASAAQDEALAKDLRSSEKDRSENLMIVDLVRNDLSRTCTVGSVAVPALMQVETYASVHQLVSTVRGKRREDVSIVRCVREAYPMGSMTGAPKIRTMSIIDDLESSARGVYSGSIGYLSLCGAADMNVVIRTAVVSGRNVEIGVGGAVVSQSTSAEEFAEILVKGKPVMEGIALATTGSRNYFVH